MTKNQRPKSNNLQWLYLVGFFLILALPLLNLPPWFSPPDWGKTIVFRIVLSVLIFIFLYQILNSRGQTSTRTSTKKDLGGCKIAFYLLVALLGINFLATVFSLDRNFSLWGSPYRSGGFVNFAFYIIFAILAFLILKKEGWQRIWDFSILIGIFVSIIAIFQQFGLISKIFIPFENRPPSTIGNPIFLAIYLLLLSFLTLSFALKEKKYLKKFLYFISFLFFLFIIIFITVTRAAILGLAVGFIYFIFFYPFKKRSISLALKIIFFILFVFGIYGFYYINTHPLPKFIQENKLLLSAVQRLSIKAALEDPRIPGWKVSWQALKARPILGYGPENFSIGFDKFYDPSLPQIETPPGGGIIGWWDRAHNFIFDISLQAGIFALMIYLLLFGVLFFQLQKLKHNPNLQIKSECSEYPNTITGHAIQATFLAYLVANFFSFDSFSSYLISFLLIAYSLHLLSEQEFSKSQDNRSGFTRISRRIYADISKWRGVIIFLLFVGLVWFIWNFNIKPLQVNNQIKVALYQTKNGDYAGAIKRMEDLLKSHTFLDGYLRLQYVEIISEAIPKGSEQTQIFLVKKARQILKENIKIQPYYTRNWLVLGNYTNVLIEKGQNDLKDEASYYFERANQLSPKRQEVFIGWTKTYFLTGDYQKAKEKAQECINLNPRLGECWWLMALINISLTEEEKAQENINIAGQNGYPIYSEDSFLQLANVYSKTKNYQKLVEVYQELIKIKPSEPRYHSSLATVYKEIGQFEKAREEAQIVLELAPEFKEEVEAFLKGLP